MLRSTLLSGLVCLAAGSGALAQDVQPVGKLVTPQALEAVATELEAAAKTTLSDQGGRDNAHARLASAKRLQLDARRLRSMAGKLGQAEADQVRAAERLSDARTRAANAAEAIAASTTAGPASRTLASLGATEPSIEPEPEDDFVSLCVRTGGISPDAFKAHVIDELGELIAESDEIRDSTVLQTGEDQLRFSAIVVNDPGAAMFDMLGIIETATFDAGEKMSPPIEPALVVTSGDVATVVCGEVE